MNDTQIRVMRHLTTGGGEREEALDDLSVLGLFDRHRTEAGATKIIESYLTVNTRGFSNGGIKRFRDTVGILSKPEGPSVVRVILDVMPEPTLSRGFHSTVGAAIANKARVALGDLDGVKFAYWVTYDETPTNDTFIETHPIKAGGNNHSPHDFR